LTTDTSGDSAEAGQAPIPAGAAVAAVPARRGCDRARGSGHSVAASASGACVAAVTTIAVEASSGCAASAAEPAEPAGTTGVPVRARGVPVGTGTAVPTMPAVPARPATATECSPAESTSSTVPAG
jgi:hypothetical protein